MTRAQLAQHLQEKLQGDERTSVELARTLGVTPVTLRLFKAGLRELGADRLERLAGLLGLGIGYQSRKE